MKKFLMICLLAVGSCLSGEEASQRYRREFQGYNTNGYHYNGLRAPGKTGYVQQPSISSQYGQPLPTYPIPRDHHLYQNSNGQGYQRQSAPYHSQQQHFSNSISSPQTRYPVSDYYLGQQQDTYRPSYPTDNYDHNRLPLNGIQRGYGVPDESHGQQNKGSEEELKRLLLEILERLRRPSATYGAAEGGQGGQQGGLPPPPPTKVPSSNAADIPGPSTEKENTNYRSMELIESSNQAIQGKAGVVVEVVLQSSGNHSESRKYNS